MDKALVESIQCPICLDIPPSEIFQCRNGHAICAKCASGVTECPSCRVQFENPKIRNRLAENILDKMTFDCDYKEQGCLTKVSRSDISSHSAKCIYGGDQVNLCTSLGISCNFIANNRCGAALVKHLEDSHLIPTCSDSVMSLVLSIVLRMGTRFYWKPFILINELDFSSIILVSFYFDFEKKAVMFNCTELPSDHSKNAEELHIVKFRINSSSPQDLPDLEWSIKAIELKQAGFAKNAGFTLHREFFDKYRNNLGSISFTCWIVQRGQIAQGNLQPVYHFRILKIR